MKFYKYLPSVLIALSISVIAYAATTTYPYTGNMQFTEQMKRDYDVLFGLFVQKTGDTLAGNLQLGTAGNGIQIKEGTGATMGTVALVAGSATVSNANVTQSTRIFLTNASNGTTGAFGTLSVSSRGTGVNFVIKSVSSTGTTVSDASTVNYVLFEAI